MEQFGKALDTAAAEDPHTPAEYKAHLRIDHDHEDTDLAAKYASALSYVQEQTGRQIVRATWDVTFDRFPIGRHSQMLPLGQLAQVDACAYTDANGDAATLTLANYVVSTSREPGFVTPKEGYTWPATRQQPDAVVWTIQAGWADAASVPGNVKATILLVFGHLYEHREETTAEALKRLPLGVRHMLEQLYFDDKVDYRPKTRRLPYFQRRG